MDKIVFGHEILALVNEQLESHGYRPTTKQTLSLFFAKLAENGYMRKGAKEYVCTKKVAADIALYAVVRRQLIVSERWPSNHKWSVEDFEDIILDNIDYALWTSKEGAPSGDELD